MKRILILTALAATLGVAAIASPAGAGTNLTDLTVVPDVGHPGDAFAVAGGGCGFTQNGVDNQQAAGRFAPRVGRATFSVAVAVAFPAPVATTVTPNPDGSWVVGFNVPAGTPPGVYQVSAACMVTFGGGSKGDGTQVIPYASATYTVPADPAAPPAPAVVSTPRFTG